MRASEIQSRKLVVFDIDDTLVHTQTQVHVIRDGRVIRSLNSHDFTLYQLQPGEEFDFADFRNAREFFEKSRPIIPMMNQLKHDINTGNRVVMVTARADFDDKELFLDTFRKYGVDMNRVHVYRAGNMKGASTEEKKKKIIRDLLNQGHYTKAIMYDDAVPNLNSFMELKQEYPDTRFYAWHVDPEGRAREFARESVAEAKTVHYNGVDISIETQDDIEGYIGDQDDETHINVTARSNGRELGHVLFSFDGEYLTPEDLEVDTRYRGQGIAATMYDYMKNQGYKIRRNPSQTAAGAGFWARHRPGQNVWEQQKKESP
jgi:ribosomal protein S18 acetylase RimI-like enzyme